MANSDHHLFPWLALPFPGLKSILEEEIRARFGRLPTQWGPFLGLEGDSTLDAPLLFSRNTWREPEILSYGSVGAAVRLLKERGLRWAHEPFELSSRGRLIEEGCFRREERPLTFRADVPEKPWGSFALLSAGELILDRRGTARVPRGWVTFAEDKNFPPNRAYLKLWELFTLHGEAPAPGERVADLGSCPGGWTWVLNQCGAGVASVDKAPLKPEIAALPGVEFFRRDVFGLKPADIGPVSAIYWDVICYPQALWDFLQPWLAEEGIRRFVCTIKLQGATDFAALAPFAAVPGSRMIHLFHNKHEVTWIWNRPAAG